MITFPTIPKYDHFHLNFYEITIYAHSLLSTTFFRQSIMHNFFTKRHNNTETTLDFIFVILFLFYVNTGLYDSLFSNTSKNTNILKYVTDSTFVAVLYLILLTTLFYFILQLTKTDSTTTQLNLYVFNFIFYALISFMITFLFLILKLLFSYNNFLLGYFQSLFFFLFFFLTYFLFLLFTKSFVYNNLVFSITKC